MSSTPETIRIALPKLFLWNEVGRFQEYPAAMARAEEGRSYTRVEVERQLFDIVPTMEFKGGLQRGRRTDGIVNTYGLERSGDRYRINGINLLKEEAGTFRATDEGLYLGDSYRENPDGERWPVLLARQLLLREPRTRLTVGLLLNGYSLQFRTTSEVPKGRIILVADHGVTTTIGQRDCRAFNELLSAQSEMALGPAWKAELAALGQVGSVRWEGVQGPDPSLNDLPLALKKSLALLIHVGLLRRKDESWRVDLGNMVRRLGEDLTATFGVAEPATKEQSPAPEEVFGRCLSELADSSGFVVLARVADRFGQLQRIPESERPAVFDSFVRQQLYDGRLRVREHHRGQPRMGRGLFGDDDFRLLRFEWRVPNETETRPAEQGASGDEK